MSRRVQVNIIGDGGGGASRPEVEPFSDPGRPSPSAAKRQELSEYDKGYLDGLLEGSRHAGARKRPDAYKEDAEKYLRSIGCEGWSVNVRRV